MAKVESKNKQNPKLVRSRIAGRSGKALRWVLSRTQRKPPVLDENGNHVTLYRGGDERKTEI